MKKFFAFAMMIALALPAMANEGMWLPMLLGRNYADMQKYGLQLTPEELYSVNHSSLKDAIVSMGGFCTGEIVSDNGLMLTNHHCGFEAVQSHSTVEHDYLTDGFWARTKKEELPNEGLFVKFLVRMEDVSERINSKLTNALTEEERDSIIGVESKEISDEAIKGTDYDANVKSFYHGNEFYLFVYITYRDVRLVGAPPSSVGKFGGDTDNWMWPRHTGDFSMFRIYTAPDGKPATYSEENIPLKPKYHLPVSLNGVQEGDFSMIFGYPGSTDRYLSSYGVKQAIDKYNPTIVKIRDLKLSIMKKYMDADPETRIQYASKYAQVSNYWKYYIGQTEQLKKNNVYAKKLVIEDDFQKWVNQNPTRQAKYGQTLNLLDEAYKESDNYVVGDEYVIEAGLTGSDLALFAFRFNRLMDASFTLKEQMKKKMDEAETDEQKKEIKEQYETKINAVMHSISEVVEEHFKDYNPQLDQELFASLFELYDEQVPASQQPGFFQRVHKKYNGDWHKYAEKVYDKSILASKESVLEYLENPSEKKLKKDRASIVGNQLIDMYRHSWQAHGDTESKLEKGYRLFTAGLREMNPDKNYYPDANSTMRMTYGTVRSYVPRDAVFYNYYTTGKGILQKEDPSDPEFIVPEKLHNMLEAKDFGRYANNEGELPVCFLTDNDITGGNSGSPVINGKGQLIGIAFDGNWEAMSGDIYFENKVQRTICVDIRYVLYIIDKYADAKNLVDEMTLVKNDETKEMQKTLPATAEEVMH